MIVTLEQKPPAWESTSAISASKCCYFVLYFIRIFILVLILALWLMIVHCASVAKSIILIILIARLAELNLMRMLVKLKADQVSPPMRWYSWFFLECLPSSLWLLLLEMSRQDGHPDLWCLPSPYRRTCCHGIRKTFSCRGINLSN